MLFRSKGHDDIHNGYDQLLAFFNNKNWKQDYNPNGGWSPTGGKRKGGSGGGGGKDWSSEPSYTNRSMATLQSQQTTATQPTSGNTANVSVSINITGGDSPRETAQAVRDRLDSYFDSSDFDIFQNNYRRT